MMMPEKGNYQSADDWRFPPLFSGRVERQCNNCSPVSTLSDIDPQDPTCSSFGDLFEEEERQAERAAALLAEAYGSWHFDAFALAEATGNRPLSTLGNFLFHESGLVEQFQLDADCLVAFFEEVERGYDDANPYHNRAHAASVLHAMHAVLEQTDLAKVVAPAFEWSDGAPVSSEGLVKMACLLAAAVHDFEHPGVSNDFLVRTMDDRAILYKDQHVNENHHISAGLKLLRDSRFNFLREMPSGDFCQLSSLMLDIVLSTDMADHNQIFRAFTAATGAPSPTRADALAPATFVPKSKQESVLLLKAAFKCCDLGHLSLFWDLHVRWVLCLEREFFAQGDREKELGFSPVSFLMDREKPGATETQVGFFDFVVLPLFKALAAALPAAQPLLEGVSKNYAQWKALQESALARIAAIEAVRQHLL